MNDGIKELLERGVEEVIDRQHLEKALTSGKKLRVKLGIDPTSPNIHIGRAVLLLKLRAFQDAGHKAVLIFGDATGVIGDTSDKDSERPKITRAQLKANMKTYADQAFKILDKKKTEIHYNSKWLDRLDYVQLGDMADLFSWHEFESREVIARRLKEGKRVSLREGFYPLLQGYDSVAIKADVELGGTDQRFNLLAGRTIQPLYKQKPQNILMMQLLEGTDGRKMSSSWGNVINITDSPKDMFGKTMSIPDNLIEKYFLLATKKPQQVIKDLMATYSNPRDQKKHLAFEIVALYYGPKQAKTEHDNFLHQFTNKELPADIPVKKLEKGTYPLIKILYENGLVASKSDARRLMEQGGIKVNQTVSVHDQNILIDGKTEWLLQVGKRKFLRVV